MSARAKLRYAPLLNRVWNRIDSRAVSANICKPRLPPAPPVKKIGDNWVSYGFDYEDHTNDTNVHHASYFFSITLCIIFGGFAWMYAPDVCLRDWAQREAFIELRRREAAGLPAIDPNYIPVKKMVLPAQKDACDLGFDILV